MCLVYGMTLHVDMGILLMQRWHLAPCTQCALNDQARVFRLSSRKFAGTRLGPSYQDASAGMINGGVVNNKPIVVTSRAGEIIIHSSSTNHPTLRHYFTLT